MHGQSRPKQILLLYVQGLVTISSPNGLRTNSFHGFITLFGKGLKYDVNPILTPRTRHSNTFPGTTSQSTLIRNIAVLGTTLATSNIYFGYRSSIHSPAIIYSGAQLRIVSEYATWDYCSVCRIILFFSGIAYSRKKDRNFCSYLSVRFTFIFGFRTRKMNKVLL